MGLGYLIVLSERHISIILFIYLLTYDNTYPMYMRSLVLSTSWLAKYLSSSRYHFSTKSSSFLIETSLDEGGGVKEISYFRAIAL